jgi:transcription factor C subunit 6
MSRQLRPRKAPVNYKLEGAMAELGIDGQASGSDFDPGEEPDIPADQNDSQDEETEADEDENRVDITTPRSKAKAATTQNRKSVSFTPTTVTPAKRKRKAAQSVTQGANIIGAGFIRRASSSTSTPSKGKSKGPSPHHRHRAVPLYSHTFPVESLSSKPTSPFSRVEKEEVKSFSSNNVVGARVSKAWAFNVGPGPLWELIEDRGWYKDAVPGKASESSRRPRVYEDVQGGELEVLDQR